MRTPTMMIAAVILSFGAIACSADTDQSDIATAGEVSDTAGGPDDADDDDSDTEDMTDHERSLAFVECMREQGVDMPDPDPDGSIRMQRPEPGDSRGGLDGEAMDACRELSPMQSGDLRDDPERLEELRNFAACMREYGIDLPDPDPNSPGGMMMGGEIVEHPRFEEAIEDCREHVSTGGTRMGGPQ